MSSGQLGRKKSLTQQCFNFFHEMNVPEYVSLIQASLFYVMNVAENVSST